MKVIKHTLPETNIAPENGWLEDYFPFWKAYFQGLLLLVLGRVPYIDLITLPPQHAGIVFTQCRAYRFPVDRMASVESGRMARTHPEGPVAPGDVVRLVS